MQENNQKNKKNLSSFIKVGTTVKLLKVTKLQEITDVTCNCSKQLLKASVSFSYIHV